MNKKTVIGFDFDKVFVSYPPFVPSALINRLYKKKSKVLSYRMPGTLERYIRILSHLPFFRAPIRPNIESLQELSKQKNLELHIISSRFSFLKGLTILWIHTHNFHKFFKSINFNYNDEQPHKFKKRMLQKLHVNVFIDDDLDLLKYLATKLPNVKYFYITENKSDEIIPPNITPIRTVNELMQKLL